MHRRDHAIVIGIETYPGISPLRGPCADAMEFHNWLIDKDGGAVPDKQAKLCLTCDFHPPDPHGAQEAHPCLVDLHRLFQPFVKPKPAKPLGRRLYIYVAGHGFSDPQEMAGGALYAANAETVGLAEHLAGTAWAEWFRRNAVFEEIVLVMDCCRTLDMLHSVVAPALPHTENAARANQVRKVYAYATGWSRTARERPVNGEWRGIFTTAVLRALREAKPNRYGWVTGEILQDYVHHVIHGIAGDTPIDPPDFDIPDHRDIRLFRRETVPGLALRIRLNRHTGNETVAIHDSPGIEVEAKPAETAVVEFSLPPGYYKAQVVGTDRSKIVQVPSDDEETL